MAGEVGGGCIISIFGLVVNRVDCVVLSHCFGSFRGFLYAPALLATQQLTTNLDFAGIVDHSSLSLEE